jgi:hypothetical protein
MLGQPRGRARPTAEIGEPPNPAIAPLLDELLSAHEDGLTLSRKLLLAQGIADETESEAARAFDRAATRPWDEELVEYAVAAAIASEEASERELEVAAQWTSHCARTRCLVEQARRCC